MIIGFRRVSRVSVRGNDVKNLFAVGLQLLPADAWNCQKVVHGRRSTLGNGLEGGVGEDDESRLRDLIRRRLPPLPQPLEQRLVVQRGAVLMPTAGLLRARGQRTAAGLAQAGP